jgi:hypothetical protein
MCEEQPQLNRRGLLTGRWRHHRRDCLSGCRSRYSIGFERGQSSERHRERKFRFVSPQPMANPAGDLTTSDIIVETLIAWGATHVFGLVGDGIAGLIEAVRKREGQIQYVGVRHEEVAAFMASGYAKLTGNARKFDRRSCRLSVPQNQR